MPPNAQGGSGEAGELFKEQPSDNNDSALPTRAEGDQMNKTEFYKMLKDGSFASMVREVMVGEAVNSSVD